jgi:formate hydrogenlyase subunit 6/NADH:ubiquinone oxidoreductase subunit I
MDKNQKFDELVNQSRRAFFTGGSMAPTEPFLIDKNATYVAKIGSQCMALDGVACQICGDICEPRAIKFFWTSKKVQMPQIDTDNCTGCSDCLSICPPKAISLIETLEVRANVK